LFTYIWFWHECWGICWLRNSCILSCIESWNAFCSYGFIGTCSSCVFKISVTCLSFQQEQLISFNSQNSNSYHFNSQNLNSYHFNSQNSNSYHFNSQNSNSYHLNIQNSNSYHFNSQNSNSYHLNSQNSNSYHFNSQNSYYSTCIIQQYLYNSAVLV